MNRIRTYECGLEQNIHTQRTMTDRTPRNYDRTSGFGVRP
jgi:hypothetical protein